MLPLIIVYSDACLFVPSVPIRMPVLVLAAQLCPEGVEATLFASLMSVMNAASALGEALGAGLTAMLGVTADNFHNLIWLVLTCNLLALLPLAFIGLIPAGEVTAQEDDKPHNEDGRSIDSLGGGRSEASSSWFQWLKRSRTGNNESEVDEKQGLMTEIEMQR